MRGINQVRWAIAGVLVALCPLLARAGTPIDVVLLGGQSNMDGRASVNQLPSNLQLPQNNIEYFYQTAVSQTNSTIVPGSLTTLRPLTNGGTNFGPEITFGHQLAADNPANKYALIKYSEGGTTLFSDWNATTNGPQYQNFQSTVTTGLSNLVSAGYTPTIVGMLWMQGETDATNATEAAAYKGNLTTFIASIRSKYGANLPFIMGGIGDDQGTDSNADPFYSTVDGAQQSVAASTANVGYFSDIDLAAAQTPAFSDIHFDSAVGGGYQTIGDRFATSLENVPEPTSLGLLSAASVLLLSGRRRRRSVPL